MLTLTSPHEIWAHRLPAALKLALLCLFTVVLFALRGPAALNIAAIGVIAMIATGGWVFLQTSLLRLRPLWPFVAIVGLWHLWIDDLAGGAEVILRMGAAVAAANFVTMTTQLSQMMAVMERLCRPLAAFGLRPRVLALAVALVIRFIPVMLQRSGEITESWQARSPRRPGWRLLVPLTLAALDDADYASDALRARGGAG